MGVHTDFCTARNVFGLEMCLGCNDIGQNYGAGGGGHMFPVPPQLVREYC